MIYLKVAAAAAISLVAGQSADSGIAEYNQVIRMVVQGRAQILSGQPDNYSWVCLDKLAACEVTP